MGGICLFKAGFGIVLYLFVFICVSIHSKSFTNKLLSLSSLIIHTMSTSVGVFLRAGLGLSNWVYDMEWGLV